MGSERQFAVIEKSILEDDLEHQHSFPSSTMHQY
jgi:hypothetical protein